MFYWCSNPLSLFCTTADSTDVGIRLNPAQILEELEGSGGTIEPSKVSGYIELHVRGEWRSVCVNFWTREDAKVACKQLGYSTDGTYCLPYNECMSEGKCDTESRTAQ